MAAALEIQLGYAPQLLVLMVARITSSLAVMRVAGGTGSFPAFRILMSLALATALAPMVPVSWVDAARQLTTVPAMLYAMLTEVLLGLALGLVFQCFLSACSIAGTLIGMGTSLSMARMVDPVTGGQALVPQQILQMLFVLLLLLGNAHLVLIGVVARSFETLPPGAGLPCDGVALVANLGTIMLDWGLRLAMPVVAVALLLDACFGLVARLAPEFDILFLSLPIRLFVGLGAMGLAIRYGGGLLQEMIEKMVNMSGQLLLLR